MSTGDTDSGPAVRSGDASPASTEKGVSPDRSERKTEGESGGDSRSRGQPRRGRHRRRRRRGGGGGGGGGGSEAKGAQQGSANRDGANRDGANRDGANRGRNEGGGGRGGDRQRSRNRRGRKGGGRNLDHRNLANLPRTATEGVLETQKDGSGYLRRLQYDFSIREDDVFVPTNLIRTHRLKEGYLIRGESAPNPKKKPNPILVSIETIEGLAPDDPALTQIIPFRDLTSLDPVEKFDIAHNTSNPSLRLMDLLAPIGKGQRGIIVAPPRTGKTMLMQGIAQSIVRNHPEVHLIVVLVDERPEEATEWKRSVDRGEVLTSTSDELAANHVNIAEIAIERAKRLVELKKDVVILLDSLTRLARAYNLETKNSGRTLSGGIDVKTLAKPKGFFGSARNVEEGGSLTIIATALIETGSRMDQVIFEEFKGTGNMELVLSRKLADLRIFPAFDLGLTGTRKEEKLIPENLLSSVWALRRVLQSIEPVEGMKILIKKIGETASNEDFLLSFKQEA